MATYNWKFPEFEVALSQDGLTNVVKVIHWRLEANDDFNFVAEYGTTYLSDPDPANFVPYEQITQDWAIARVSAQVDVAAAQERLTQQLANLLVPPIVPLPPPF